MQGSCSRVIPKTEEPFQAKDKVSRESPVQCCYPQTFVMNSKLSYSCQSLRIVSEKFMHHKTMET